MSDLGRRAEVQVLWQSKDISGDIAPYLVGVTVADPISGATNDLSIDLEDRDGKWANEWRPKFGDVAEVRIRSEAWLTGVTSLSFGVFSHDTATFSGPPHKVAIKCVSAGLATGIRRHRKNMKRSSVTLQQIAQEIADAAGLKLSFTADDSQRYGRREQKDQSDLDFLLGLCSEAGKALKVGDDTIVIFEEEEFEKKPSIGTIDLIGGHVLGWEFTDGKSDHYGRCRVSCTKARTGKKIEGTFRDPSDEGPTLEVKRAVENQGEAETIAKALLRSANRGAKTGKVTVVGDPGIYGGAVFDLTNAFSFDGRYVVTRAEHRPTGGYVTGMDVRRVLEGY